MNPHSVSNHRQFDRLFNSNCHCWFRSHIVTVRIWHFCMSIIFQLKIHLCIVFKSYHIAKFMGPTWGPPGSCQPQMGPMFTQWILLSGVSTDWFTCYFHTMEAHTQALSFWYQITYLLIPWFIASHRKMLDDAIYFITVMFNTLLQNSIYILTLERCHPRLLGLVDVTEAFHLNPGSDFTDE